MSILLSGILEKVRMTLSVGFQCAPLGHEALHTDSDGAARYSVGRFSKREEITILLEALASLT